MIRLFFVCFVAWLLTSCGKDSSTGATNACGGTHNGSYAGIIRSDRITLSEACAFTYQGSDGCRSNGTYASPLGASGTVQVLITSATAGVCLTAGTYTCAYTLSDPNMSFNCGAGTAQYRKE